MISLIIPHWPLNEEVDQMLDACRQKIVGYDELILVVNNGIGFGKAVNWGLKMAKGDFLAVVSNDVFFTKNNLKELVDEKGATSGYLNGDVPSRGLWGCCFMLPRWVYEKIGGFDEQFNLAYYEDDDYCLRLKEAGIPMITKNVHFESKGGQTLKFIPERMEKYAQNRQKFLAKWPNATLHG